MTGTPSAAGLRFVTCLTCDHTVPQTLDAESHWRPDPALCEDCKAANARQAAAWARQVHQLKRFIVTVAVEAEDPVQALLAAGDLLGDEQGAAQLAALGDAVIQIQEQAV